MKKACLGVTIILILGMAACSVEPGEVSTLPTQTVAEEVMGTPEVSDVPVATETPDLTPTLQPMEELQGTDVTMEPTKVPTATNAPTATPMPTATPKPTVTPKPTATLKPAVAPKATLTPAPTVTPKPTATPKQISSEISKLLERAEEHKNTIMRGTVCESREQTDEFVREMAFEYSSFGVLVEEAEDLRSSKEYMELYPEIEYMEIEKVDIYRNCICATVSGVKISYDVQLCYAIRTGDISVLSATEKEIYAYLKDVIEETNAKKLSRIDAVKALHDYLVLNLKYDESFQILSHSPEGVMKNKTAVCDGYARTMRLLLLMIGIDSKIVNGSARNEFHAWNLVKLEDGWYHIDVTWDDPIPDVEGKIGYLYFLRNDADMAKTHVWESEISCTKNNYQEYVYGEVLCDSYDTMLKVYNKQIETEEYLTFCYPKGGVLTEGMILDYVKKQAKMSIVYYPEKELADYMVLEIVNPLWE